MAKPILNSAFESECFNALHSAPDPCCCCSLPFHLCAYFTCSSVHTSTLHLLLAHHHLCYVDVYCVFDTAFIFCYFCFYIFLCLLGLPFVLVELVTWIFCLIYVLYLLQLFLLIFSNLLLVTLVNLSSFCALVIFWTVPAIKKYHSYSQIMIEVQYLPIQAAQ